MQSDERQCLYNPMARLANLRPPGRPVGARYLDLHGGVTPRQIAMPFDNDVCLTAACRSSSWPTSWRQLLQHDRVDAALEVAVRRQKLPRDSAVARLIPCRGPCTGHHAAPASQATLPLDRQMAQTFRAAAPVVLHSARAAPDLQRM